MHVPRIKCMGIWLVPQVRSYRPYQNPCKTALNEHLLKHNMLLKQTSGYDANANSKFIPCMIVKYSTEHARSHEFKRPSEGQKCA